MATTGTKMKIKCSFTVEVDPEDWAEAFGLERSEVRKDVQTYLARIAQEYVDQQIGY
jgi:hypothetical protein